MTAISEPARTVDRSAWCDAVGEQRAVREAGDWIVERLMCELLFERLALADVTAVEHDPLDVLVVQQLRMAYLELQPATVVVLQ